MFLTKIQDLQEQLLNIHEVILDVDMISKILFPPSYLNGHTLFTLSRHCVYLVQACKSSTCSFRGAGRFPLQEKQARKNKSFHMGDTDQAFVVQNKGKGKVGDSYQSKSGSRKSSDKPLKFIAKKNKKDSSLGCY